MRRRRYVRMFSLALVAAAGSGLVAGCDTNDGRAMKDPDPYQEFQLQSTNPTTTSTTTTIAPVTIASTSTSTSTSTSSSTSTSTSTSTSSTVADSADGSTADSSSVTGVTPLDNGSEAAPISTVDPALSADTLAESLGLTDLADERVRFTGPWTPGSPIAIEYSCDGDGEAPLLTWTAPPDGTAEIALTVTDETSDPAGFVHWIVIALPPEAGSVGGPEPIVVGTEAMNSTGDLGWRSVCPPDRDEHTYRFSLYALTQPIELPAESLPRDLITAIEASASGVTSFTGTYQRA